MDIVTLLENIKKEELGDKDEPLEYTVWVKEAEIEQLERQSLRNKLRRTQKLGRCLFSRPLEPLPIVKLHELFLNFKKVSRQI